MVLQAAVMAIMTRRDGSATPFRKRTRCCRLTSDSRASLDGLIPFARMNCSKRVTGGRFQCLLVRGVRMNAPSLFQVATTIYWVASTQNTVRFIPWQDGSATERESAETTRRPSPRAADGAGVAVIGVRQAVLSGTSPRQGAGVDLDRWAAGRRRAPGSAGRPQGWPHRSGATGPASQETSAGPRS